MSALYTDKKRRRRRRRILRCVFTFSLPTAVLISVPWFYDVYIKPMCTACLLYMLTYTYNK